MSHLNIKTLLNVKEKFKGFVFKNTRLTEKNNTRRIEVDVVARKGSQGQCSQCGADEPHLRSFTATRISLRTSVGHHSLSSL